MAAIELKGDMSADRFVKGEWHQCRAPVADICVQPEGSIDCQILFGERFRVLESRQNWSFGQSERDGYCGYIEADLLSPCQSSTHRVISLSSHIYRQPDIKSRPAPLWYPFGARIAIDNEGDNFCQIVGGGFVPSMHLCHEESRPQDHVPLARLFLGVPYLWGGNGPLGIDCSGLVQMVLMMTGFSCPRDADLQWQWMTKKPSREDVRTGDFVFWNDHVGIIDEKGGLIHANAHHMQVVREPLEEVCERISTQNESEFLGFAHPPKRPCQYTEATLPDV